MKNLILILSLIVVSFAHAADGALGGTLVNKRGEALELRCTIGYDEDCSEIGVFAGRYGEELVLINTIAASELDLKEINRNARVDSARDLNGEYTAIGFIGTAVGLLSDNAIVFSLGVLVDLAKSPVVLATYIPHRIAHLITFNRIKRKVKFMLNAEKIGKTKRISIRDLQALSNNID